MPTSICWFVPEALNPDEALVVRDLQITIPVMVIDRIERPSEN